jgi:acyl-CoA reductase-like NAD-dependent aldehyde dehydrogenase
MQVRSPYDGRVVGEISLADDEQVERAVAAAHAQRRNGLPAHVLATALRQISDGIAERAEEAAQILTAESGKPLQWARVEVSRAIATFGWAAQEARTFSGELQRLDTDPGGVGRLAITRRVPVGPVLGITPFNFPLNLVAHKVAPALAIGAPVVIKPAPRTPLSALLLAEIVAKTDLPEGMFAVLNMTNEQTVALVRDPRLPVVSFTGSVPVGWSIRDSVPRKKVILELGGNGAVVVCPDWRSEEDLDWAATRIATFSNYQAGQSCISVQRVYAHQSLYDDLLARIIAKVERLVTGDPSDEATQVGPLIDEDSAKRVEAWVRQAEAGGARVATGGVRSGTSYAPTVLTGVPDDAKVIAEEVFGPVLSVLPVDSVDEAFAKVNDSRFGLQTGVFTHNLRIAFQAGRELEVGGVIVGDVPSYRADNMPYGGVKDSGVGREGVRSAMEDLSEERVLVLTEV